MLLAEVARLLGNDRPGEAAEVLQVAQRLVAKAGMRNQYVAPLLPWLATVLSREAERPGCSGERRQALLRRADGAARQGLRLARTFQNDLPHALRESALQEAARGRARRARRLFDDSLTVAERRGARYEHAQTMLARAEIGLKFGWRGSADEAAAARQSLLTIEQSRSAVVSEELA